MAGYEVNSNPGMMNEAVTNQQGMMNQQGMANQQAMMSQAMMAQGMMNQAMMNQQAMMDPTQAVMNQGKMMMNMMNMMVGQRLDLSAYKTFEQHWEETLQLRKKNHSMSVVAPGLERFQDKTHFIKTNQPLHQILATAAQKRNYKFERENPWQLCSPYLVCVLFAPAGWAVAMMQYAGVFNTSRYDPTWDIRRVNIALALCTILATVAAFVLGWCLFNLHVLHCHITALHMLYMADNMPLPDHDGPVCIVHQISLTRKVWTGSYVLHCYLFSDGSVTQNKCFVANQTKRRRSR